jgi:hypothetical protein
MKEEKNRKPGADSVDIVYATAGLKKKVVWQGEKKNSVMSV